MNKLKLLLSNENLFNNSNDWALLGLRVIPSFYLFYYHGLNKVLGGTGTWQWLGEAAMSALGINFGFVFFGFLAAISEGILTWFVMLGLQTRIASLFTMLTMFFAGTYHLSKGESPESAFIYFIIYFTIFLCGPGKFSIDSKFNK